MFLSEIIRNFDSQLSQEQTWAICCVTAKYLAAKKRENMINRRNVRFEIEAETVQLTGHGSVVIMMKEDRGPKQIESEIIQDLGRLICKCLDTGVDNASLMSNNNLERDLIDLISGMMVHKFNENDEGYAGDFNDALSSRRTGSGVRLFRNLDEICRYCDDRLYSRKIKSESKHYRNVVKALYGEALELKLFLDHVNSSLCLASENVSHRNLEPSVANTAQECVYEWARLWLQVMHELRRGVHLRKVAQTKISPEEYELSPYEMAADSANSTRTLSKPGEKSGLPENASEMILNFILSRPGEKEMKLLPYVEEADQLENELDDEELSNILEEEKNENFDRRRKSLKVESPLWSQIHNWDASLESLISDDTTLGKEGSSKEGKESLAGALFDKEKESRRNSVDRRRSADLSVSIRTETGDEDAKLEPIGSRDGSLATSKKRLAVSALCLTEVSLEEDPRAIGTSLFEISKIRQAITVAEVDSLPNNNTRNRSIRNGKICFSCRKTTFSLFSKSYQCHICSKKFCSKCTETNIEIPNHLVDVRSCKEEEKTGDLVHAKGLSKSLGNLVAVGSDMITPFRCKRQSMLKIGSNRAFGGKTATVCNDCKCFLDSIITETTNLRWHVGMAMDI